VLMESLIDPTILFGKNLKDVLLREGAKLAWCNNVSSGSQCYSGLSFDFSSISHFQVIDHPESLGKMSLDKNT
jgi:hypothetical protein